MRDELEEEEEDNKDSMTTMMRVEQQLQQVLHAESDQGQGGNHTLAPPSKEPCEVNAQKSKPRHQYRKHINIFACLFHIATDAVLLAVLWYASLPLAST